jgi:hypothetical protein
VTGKRTAAAAAEEAELRALSERAEQSRHELGQTVQALARKVTDETDVGAIARRQAAHLTARLRHTASSAPRRPAAAGGRIWAQATRGPRRGAYVRMAAIVVPTAALAAVLVVWQARSRGDR